MHLFHKPTVMKPELYLHIPTPCHEDWDKMTPVQKGKFCGSCNKEVVDFSLMTDAEVLNFFIKSTGNTCGRFYNDQLQRPLQETKIEKKRGWKLILASVSSLLMIVKVNAQKKINDIKLKGKVSEERMLSCPPIIVGDVSIKSIDSVKPVNNIINGIVSDENKQPIAGATVLIKGTKTGTIANEKGEFSLKLDAITTSKTLVVNSVGFISKEIVVTPQQIQQQQIIQLKLSQEIMGEIIVTTPVNRTITISGKVVDEKNNPIPGASIFERNRLAGVADEKGNFKITSHTLQDTLPIKISSLGFEDEKATIDLLDDEVYAKVIMKSNVIKLPEIIVNAQENQYLTGRVGGVTATTSTRVTKKDTTLAAVRRALDNSIFTVIENPLKVYPNPAVKNATINLLISEAGNYAIQLFDLQSKIGRAHV